MVKTRIRHLMLCFSGLILLSALAVETVEQLLITPKTVETVDELLEIFREARSSIPPLPSPISYEDVARQLSEDRYDFISLPMWAYVHDAGTYYLSDKSKLARKLNLPIRLLAYEDLASGKIVLAATSLDSKDVQSLAIVDAPVFSAYDGKRSVESHLMQEIGPRRVIWSALLKSEDDAWSDLLQQQTESISFEPMMMAMSMTEPITDFRIIQNGTNLSVNLPDEFAGATISLQSKTNLLDAGWATVLQTNASASGILSLGAVDLPDVPCEMTIITNAETIYIDPLDGSTNVIPAGVYTNYEYSTAAAFYRASATSTNDTDSDGIDNITEYDIGTNYQNLDSDNDGVSDGEEVLTYGLDPNDTDSDDDGLSDSGEVALITSTNNYGAGGILIHMLSNGWYHVIEPSLTLISLGE